MANIPWNKGRRNEISNAFVYLCHKCKRVLNGIRPNRIRKNPVRFCWECHLKNQPAKQKHPLGYVVIRTGIRRRDLEHRIIMEKFLGRKLLKGEVVHHINGVRDDNRIENLTLCESPGKHVFQYHNEISFNRKFPRVDKLKEQEWQR